MLIAPEKPEQKWQIWNPSTHESLDLPQPDFDSLKHVANGLGFDESTDDYKAVVIDSRSHRRPGEREVYVYRTHVYSLKSDSWRTITDFPWHDMWGPKGPGVFMCGSLNWFLSPFQNYERIIALDLGTETYRELKVPSLPDRPFVMCQERYLDVLDSGRLILSDYGFIFMNKLQNFDVWVMQDYEVDDSWARCFSVEGDYGVTRDVVYGLRYVAFLKDRLQFFMQDRWGFYLHDVQSSSMKRVGIEGLAEILSIENNIRREGALSAQVVPESIFRLHDNCGVRGRRIVMDKEESVQMSEKELIFSVGDAIKWHIF